MTTTKFKSDPFREAKALKMKLKMLMMGESGTGKTWTALELATRLAKLENGKVAFLDSEGGNAQVYAPYFEFHHMVLSKTSPQDYIQAIYAAVQFGYKVVVVDSFSHAWNGPGGVLEIVDKAKKGWMVGKPEHQKLIRAIQLADIHIIGTVRVKNSYEKVNDQIDWKTAKVDARQDGEFEYEFAITGLLDRDHNLTLRTSKCFGLKAGHSVNSGEGYDAMVSQLHGWLNAGDEPPFWLETEQGRDFLTSKLKLLGTTKEDYPEMLRRLGVKGFSETTLPMHEYFDLLDSIFSEIKSRSNVTEVDFAPNDPDDPDDYPEYVDPTITDDSNDSPHEIQETTIKAVVTQKDRDGKTIYHLFNGCRVPVGTLDDLFFGVDDMVFANEIKEPGTYPLDKDDELIVMYTTGKSDADRTAIRILRKANKKTIELGETA